MKIREEWQRPVSQSGFWTAMLVAVLLVSGICFFTQSAHHARIERLVWPALLILVWLNAVYHTVKFGWRIWQSPQTLFLIGYTMFVGGDLLPKTTAASWVTNIGFLLFVCWMMFNLFDFTKPRKPTDALPPPA